jgi:hypothetical protein
VRFLNRYSALSLRAETSKNVSHTHPESEFGSLTLHPPINTPQKTNPNAEKPNIYT